MQLCAECDQLRDQLADPAKPTPPPLFDLFAAAYDGEPAPQPATVEHEGRAYDAHDLEPVDD